MNPGEAIWLSQALAQFSGERISPLLNVGSGSDRFRRVEQPWIEQFIVEPLIQKGVEITHLDINDAPGVDVVGDPCDSEVSGTLASVGFQSILCTNVLEHVRCPKKLAGALLAVVPDGALLCVTAPNAYPYHACPIDNLYRPDVGELHSLFPGSRVLAGEIVECGSFLDEIRAQPLLLPRLLLPFYKPRNWYGLVRRLPWLARRYLTTCMLLEKTSRIPRSLET